MIIDLSSMPIAATPLGFTEGLTGHGDPVCWRVLDDPSTPGGRIISETSREPADYRFPLYVYNGFVADDVEVSVRFKAVGGEVDQAGGLILRAQDHLNYYVARANALEDNIRLYKVVAGVRRQVTGRIVKVSAGAWHTLSQDHRRRSGGSLRRDRVCSKRKMRPFLRRARSAAGQRPTVSLISPI